MCRFDFISLSFSFFFFSFFFAFSYFTCYLLPPLTILIQWKINNNSLPHQIIIIISEKIAKGVVNAGSAVAFAGPLLSSNVTTAKLLQPLYGEEMRQETQFATLVDYTTNCTMCKDRSQ